MLFGKKEYKNGQKKIDIKNFEISQILFLIIKILNVKEMKN
jgi:hypothetical protein